MDDGEEPPTLAEPMTLVGAKHLQPTPPSHQDGAPSPVLHHQTPPHGLYSTSSAASPHCLNSLSPHGLYATSSVALSPHGISALSPHGIYSSSVPSPHGLYSTSAAPSPHGLYTSSTPASLAYLNTHPYLMASPSPPSFHSSSPHHISMSPHDAAMWQQHEEEENLPSTVDIQAIRVSCLGSVEKCLNSLSLFRNIFILCCKLFFIQTF